MRSLAYLLIALLLFLLGLYASHRNSKAWIPVICAAVFFLVQGARSGPPKPS